MDIIRKITQNTTEKIIAYAGLEEEKNEKLRQQLSVFATLEDKRASTDEVNKLRRSLTALYYDYYEAVISDEIDFLGRKFPMIAVRYYFILDDGEKIMFYGNYKFSSIEPYESIEMFNLVIQLGAIMAVVVLYFNKLNPFSPKKDILTNDRTKCRKEYL